MRYHSLPNLRAKLLAHQRPGRIFEASPQYESVTKNTLSAVMNVQSDDLDLSGTSSPNA